MIANLNLQELSLLVIMVIGLTQLLIKQKPLYILKGMTILKMLIALCFKIWAI